MLNRPGSVDGGDINRYTVRYVSYSPARATISGVPNDVECAPDIREVRKIAKRRVFRGKTVLPV